MQVVSGPVGREKVHYEAPPARRVPEEMSAFLSWFAKPGDTDPLLVAGLAHLWFVTIHPFDDGNGRIARAIADMALARAEGAASASTACRRRSAASAATTTDARTHAERRARRHALAGVVPACLLRAIEGSQDTLGAVLTKARFWERFAKKPLNERQIKVLNRLLDGFEGKLTTSKWAKLAKCSQDTAYRDILDLVERGALRKDAAAGAARATRLSRVSIGNDASESCTQRICSTNSGAQ